MKRIKLALKAALIPTIVGLVFFVVGAVLLIVWFSIDNGGLLISGIVGLVIGICGFIWAVANVKARLNAICPECQKFMGDSAEPINFEYVITDYKPNYNNSTGKIDSYTFNYNWTAVCPHCGNSVTHNNTTRAKSEAKANTQIHKYLQSILKLKK